MALGVALGLAVLIGVLAATTAQVADAATVPGSNVVTFFHDRWHPERTVVGSSAVFRREPPPPLELSISVQPVSATAGVQTVLKNTSDSAVFFTRAGVSVDAAVVRNGRALQTWTLRDAALRSLAPGQSVTIEAAFDLPMPGNYTVSATARY